MLTTRRSGRRAPIGSRHVMGHGAGSRLAKSPHDGKQRPSASTATALTL